MPKTAGQPDHSPAAEVMGACFAGRIRLLNRTITGLYDEHLRAIGLTAGQLTTLSFIEHYGPIAPGELAKRLMMEKSTLSRNLARMERNGWVTIARGDAGHTRIVEIARRGNQMIAKALPRWRDAQAQAAAILGQKGSGAILTAFDKVRVHGARG